MGLVSNYIPKLVKDYVKPVEMFLSCPQEYDYVIQVGEAINEIQFTEAILHEPLKGSQCVA